MADPPNNQRQGGQQGRGGGQQGRGGQQNQPAPSLTAKCEDIPGLLTGNFSPEVKRAARGHLSSCDACWSKVEPAVIQALKGNDASQQPAKPNWLASLTQEAMKDIKRLRGR